MKTEELLEKAAQNAEQAEDLLKDDRGISMADRALTRARLASAYAAMAAGNLAIASELRYVKAMEMAEKEARRRQEAEERSGGE